MNRNREAASFLAIAVLASGFVAAAFFACATCDPWYHLEDHPCIDVAAIPGERCPDKRHKFGVEGGAAVCRCPPSAAPEGSAP